MAAKDIMFATDARAKILHKLDEKMPIRYSHENEDVKKEYVKYGMDEEDRHTVTCIHIQRI